MPPVPWADLPQWRVLDTRFGDGIHFLTTWADWRADARRPRLLHWVALLPKAPSAASLLAGAGAAGGVLQPLARDLMDQWHGLLPGWHRLAFDDGRVLLTLCIGEARAMLRAQHFEADDIVLRGPPRDIAQPAGTHPEHDAAATDSDRLKAVARFARRGTRLQFAGTAPPPAEALAQVGFRLALPDGAQDVQGMQGAAAPSPHAVFDPPWTVRRRTPSPVPALPGHCAVIGAGLAGAAVASSLARRGWRVTVFDAAQPAAGASGLPVGLLAPHVSPDDALLSRLTRAGIRVTWQQLAQYLAEDTDWRATGVLERRDTAEGSAHDTRLPPHWRAVGPNESWHASAAQLAAAGLPGDAQAIWHARAGWVRPARLVAAWLAQPGITVRAPCRVDRLAPDGAGWVLHDPQGRPLAQADRVVIAAGLDSAAFAPGLPLQPVRGQVAWGHGQPPAGTPVNGDGHLVAGVPDAGGVLWLAGATYQRDDRGIDLRDADLQANRARLARLHPGAARALSDDFDRGRVNSWAGIRCASTDRRPLVGPLAAHRSDAGSAASTLWLCAALGSRGLTFAALCAELLAARWHAEPLPLPAKLADALDIRRI